MTEAATPLKKIAEGREAEMFEWEGGRVLRLYRPEITYTTAAHQARLLELAGSCGVRVPATYGLKKVDGREGIVLEKLDGPDLLTELGGKPWLVFEVAGICGRVQAKIHDCVAPPELESTHERYRRIITHSDLVPAEIKTSALQRLDSLPGGDRLCHGDFHPGNVMWNDGQPVVIDWSNVTRGAPEADFFRTYLMGVLGDLPPGSPIVVRMTVSFGRKLFRDGHVRAYRRVRKLDAAFMDAWRLPVAAARIAEGIEAERRALLRYISRLPK